MVIDLNNIGEVRNNNQDVIKRIYGNRNNIIWEKYIEYDESLYKNQYFTIEPYEPLEGNYAVTIYAPEETYYKIGSGEWTKIQYGGGRLEIIVENGQKIQFKSTIDYDKEPNVNFRIFYVSQVYKVYGNLLSLEYGDLFRETQDVIHEGGFYAVFKETMVKDASNLIMPSGTLSSGCFNSMFWGCNYLTKTPKLPAPVLCNSCYMFMFAWCSNLTDSPWIYARSVVYGAENCMKDMFSGCSNMENLWLLGCPDIFNYLSRYYSGTWLSGCPEKGQVWYNRRTYWIKNQYWDSSNINNILTERSTNTVPRKWIYRYIPEHIIINL